MFKLIPLYDTQAILKNWGYLAHGMDEVLGYTMHECNLTKVVNEILSGQLVLWIGFLDDKYAGFITTRFDSVPMGERALSIIHLYAKDKSFFKILFEGIKLITEVAKKNGAKYIRFWTIRDKGFEKILNPYGFKLSYTEFIKEVE